MDLYIMFALWGGIMGFLVGRLMHIREIEILTRKHNAEIAAMHARDSHGRFVKREKGSAL